MIIYLFSSFVISVLTGFIFLKKAHNNNRFNSLVRNSIVSAFDAPRLIFGSANCIEAKFEWNYSESLNGQLKSDSCSIERDENEEDFYTIMNYYDESKKKCRYTSVSQRMTVVTLQ